MSARMEEETPAVLIGRVEVELQWSHSRLQAAHPLDGRGASSGRAAGSRRLVSCAFRYTVSTHLQQKPTEGGAELAGSVLGRVHPPCSVTGAVGRESSEGLTSMTRGTGVCEAPSRRIPPPAPRHA